MRRSRWISSGFQGVQHTYPFPSQSIRGPVSTARTGIGPSRLSRLPQRRGANRFNLENLGLGEVPWTPTPHGVSTVAFRTLGAMHGIDASSSNYLPYRGTTLRARRSRSALHVTHTFIPSSITGQTSERGARRHKTAVCIAHSSDLGRDIIRRYNL